MKNPTMQELMEYLDGTLHPFRYHEIDVMISKSSSLQKELLLLKAIQKTVRNDTVVPASKNFITNVMKEILPVQQESFWFRLVKNSSNMFAMVLVLSMIGIVLVSTPSSWTGSTTTLSKSIESYNTAYNSALETISMWTKHYAQTVNHITKSSGKFLYIGIATFFISMIVDSIFGKKYFHVRTKH
jgi:hypothetical protein